MSENDRPRSSDAAAAIDDVLAAETTARQAMEACRKTAEETLEAAREDARRIRRRANQRISRLHNHCDQRVRERIESLRKDAAQDAVRTELDAADREMLARAVERLARQLTRRGDG